MLLISGLSEIISTLLTCGKMASMFSYMGRYIVLAHEDFTTLVTGEDVAGTFDSSPSSVSSRVSSI